MSDEVHKLEDMLMNQRELFAEESLRGIFSNLVTFVIQTEQIIATTVDVPGKRFTLEEGPVENLVIYIILFRSFVYVYICDDDIFSYYRYENLRPHGVQEYNKLMMKF